jgi:hypothetical protein
MGIGFVLLFLTGLLAAREPDCQRPLLGAWEYRQRAGEGYDEEGERLELSCNIGSVHGLYFGLEREGEHGLFYTLVELTDLKLGPNGDLTFTVPDRSLFRRRPKSLQEVKENHLTSAGFTRDTLHLRGRLQEGNLVLACTSTGHSCPEDRMLFGRGK